MDMKQEKQTWNQHIRKLVLSGNPPQVVKGYTITGKVYNTNKFFKALKRSTWEAACMINLWNGSIWANIEDGTRVLIKRVIN